MRRTASRLLLATSRRCIKLARRINPQMVVRAQVGEKFIGELVAIYDRQREHDDGR